MDGEAQGDFETRVETRLARIYGAARAPEISRKLLSRLKRGACAPTTRFSEREVILITYGDSLTRRGEAPLHTLKQFLDEHLDGIVSTVHVLPFYPYSSDDGFAVVDYRQVNPMLGEWAHIEALGERFGIMYDLVLNHISSRSTWFAQFLGDRPPGRDYFIEIDPTADLSGVVRPRVQPVAAGFETERGFRFVWATFSEDQIDLNFENPDVLVEMIDVFQSYLLRGARAVRLDAVAFLWKEIGTSCIHLPQTHEVVRLMRDVLEEVSPGSILLTETNVPHAENVSYFGGGDEAHMVYQFSLPPLLLHALYSGNGRYLTQWAQDLQPAPPGCTFFNFTASHDGVGMRPAEGLLPQDEVDALCAGMQALGGHASSRTKPDGTRSVYELNITWFDAMRATAGHTGDAEGDGYQVARFLCSQLVALSLQGIPGLYIQCVVATSNDHEAVDHSGRCRSINRHKWALPDLLPILEDPHTPQHRIFHALRHALEVRREEPAFHPETSQQVLDMGDAVFALRRGDHFWMFANLTDQPQTLTLPADCSAARGLHERLSDTRLPAAQRELQLQPYQVVWLH